MARRRRLSVAAKSAAIRSTPTVIAASFGAAAPELLRKSAPWLPTINRERFQISEATSLRTHAVAAGNRSSSGGTGAGELRSPMTEPV
jgi:hypothetical protein